MATQQFLTKGQSLLKLSFDTGLDNLIDADDLQILFKKPDDNETTGAFSPVTINGTKVEYDIQEGDIDVSGSWEFRAYVVFGGRDAEGSPVIVNFADSLKS